MKMAVQKTYCYKKKFRLVVFLLKTSVLLVWHLSTNHDMRGFFKLFLNIPFCPLLCIFFAYNHLRINIFGVGICQSVKDLPQQVTDAASKTHS